MARGTAQTQRMLPVALLQAEAAWTAGRAADIVPLTDDDVDRSASAVGEPWLLAELAWWRALGGAVDDVPFELPEPFALMRDGRVLEASEAWSTIGRPFWAALALTAGDPADTCRGGRGSCCALDAPASAQAVRRDLGAARAAGAPGPARHGPGQPRGPDRAGARRAAPAGGGPVRRGDRRAAHPVRTHCRTSCFGRSCASSVCRPGRGRLRRPAESRSFAAR